MEIMEEYWSVLVTSNTQDKTVTFQVVDGLQEKEGTFSLKDKTIYDCMEHLEFIAKKEGDAARFLSKTKLIIQGKLD